MHDAGHIAIGDQPDCGAGGADLCDQVLVAGAFQNADGDVGGLHATGPGQCRHPLGRGHVEADHVLRIARPDGQLVHIDIGGVQQRAARGHGDHGQGIGHVLRGQRRAFQRVEGDIDLGARTIADFLADEQHRGLVALALADDDDALDIQKVQLVAHGVHGGLIGGLFVAAPDQRGRGMGCGLGHAGEAQREHTVVEILGRGHLFSPERGGCGLSRRGS